MSLALALAGCAGCGGGASEQNRPAPTPGSDEAPVARSASCPAQLPAPEPLPGTTAEHATLAYWLDRDGADLDRELLRPAEILAHNRALTADSENGLPIDRGSLSEDLARERLEREVSERLAYMREKIESGDYVDRAGAPLSPDARGALADASVRPDPSLRIALDTIPIRCAPRAEGLYKTPVDPTFDRNNCSSARAQEPVQVIMRWPTGMLLARTRYSLGWIAADAPLSPPLADEDAAAFLQGTPTRVATGATLAADDGARLTAAGELLLPSASEAVLFADAAGVHRAPGEGLASALRPLTRRAVLEEAFARLGQPYG